MRSKVSSFYVVPKNVTVADRPEIDIYITSRSPGTAQVHTTYSIHFTRCFVDSETERSDCPEMDIYATSRPLGQRPEFRVRICLDRPKKKNLDRNHL